MNFQFYRDGLSDKERFWVDFVRELFGEWKQKQDEKIKAIQKLTEACKGI